MTVKTTEVSQQAKGVTALTQTMIGWGVPAILGALAALLLSKSGDDERVAAMGRELVEVKAEVTYLKNNYTPARTTETLQQEVRELSRTMNTKLDVMSNQLNDVMVVLSTGNSALLRTGKFR